MKLKDFIDQKLDNFYYYGKLKYLRISRPVGLNVSISAYFQPGQEAAWCPGPAVLTTPA